MGIKSKRYADYENEFIEGYIKGTWKTISQFAISIGVDQKNGALRRATAGWVKKAKKKIQDIEDAIITEVEQKAKERIIESKVDDYVEIFTNLGIVAKGMSERLKNYVECKDKDGNDLPEDWFELKDDNGEVVMIDHKAIKSILETSILAHTLLKKTHIEDIPLTAENKQKIEEAKQIKANEKTQEITDPLADITEEELDKEIAKLDD
ncbi:hypothetical protein KAR91_46660 [Candidatus Pacearchaeota archaeon]|nr:hypothetical protein [Candidatus Pacearchaeota archaeon]